MGFINVATGLLFLALGWSGWHVFRSDSTGFKRPWIFLLSFFVLMLVLRWPHISMAHELNADESQMLAQAMRYLSHPIPWRDVDGTTGGPLNSLFLSAALKCGAPANYETARIILWASICASLAFLYLALRRFASATDAIFVLIPFLCFYALVMETDFCHYSSETLPVLLLSAGFYLLSKEWGVARASSLRLFLLGIAAGSMPFTKLQAGPLGVYLAAAGVIIIAARHRREGWRNATWGKEIMALCLGGLVAPILIMGPVILAGAFGDFWKSYLRASAHFTDADQTSELSRMRELLATRSDITPLLCAGLEAVLLLPAACLIKRAWPKSELLRPLNFVLVGIALAIGCIAAAGRTWQHYLLLLVPFTALALGLAFLSIKQLMTNPEERGTGPLHTWGLWLSLMAILVIGSPPFQTFYYYQWLAGHYHPGKPEISRSEPARALAELTGLVRAASHPGDTMSVWGWEPCYYVESGLAPATRDAIGHSIISRHPLQNYFRERYLGDLERGRPAFFVDAVAAGAFRAHWTDADRHESFPALSQFIADNYTLYGQVQYDPKGSPVRIYLSKERWAELAANGKLPNAQTQPRAQVQPARKNQ